MSNVKGNDFVAWEYTDIDVKRSSATLYKDCYQNFGWIFIEQCELYQSPEIPHHNVVTGNHTQAAVVVNEQEMVKLKFRRNSRLENKSQVEQLQHRCENALTSINSLENKKSAYFMGPIMGFGGVGAAFLGFSIFNFAHANIPLGAVSAVISLASWIAAYCFFAKISPKKKEHINPQIKEQFEIVYQTCEQASGLLV